MSISMRSSARYHVTGATMIEVLVSVVIISVGLLGIAALQLMAVRNSQQSLQESLATMYSYSLLDSMRANREAALSGAYNVSGLKTAPNGSGLVASDQKEWIQSVQQELGSDAKGSILCNGGDCSVTVEWTDVRTKKLHPPVVTRTQL